MIDPHVKTHNKMPEHVIQSEGHYWRFPQVDLYDSVFFMRQDLGLPPIKWYFKGIIYCLVKRVDGVLKKIPKTSNYQERQTFLLKQYAMLVELTNVPFVK